mgnify:CR=1 FL=1
MTVTVSRDHIDRRRGGGEQQVRGNKRDAVGVEGEVVVACIVGHIDAMVLLMML